jgi:hypothetical protein
MRTTPPSSATTKPASKSFSVTSCARMAPLELPTEDHIALRIDAVNLKDWLGDVQTDCRDRLHR